MSSLAQRTNDSRGHARDESTEILSKSDQFAVTAEAKLLRRLYQSLTGKYELLGCLGRGGMGAVYLAHDLALDRQVAIKIMLPEFVPGSGIKERFMREARTVASLNHANIVPVYAVHETEDMAYFVMRYVEGRTLASILRHNGPLPNEIAQSLLQQVGRGLAHAHRNGVVHRDIKPANIIVDKDGWALIADFGIAKVRGSDDLTLTGTVVGTPSYMSPEQCSDLRVTSASDQYALGIVAYEILTGHPPFRGTTIASVVKQQLFDQARSIADVLPTCPPTLAQAVTRMLAKSPKERWPSIEEAGRQIGGTPQPDSIEARSEIVEVVCQGPTAPVTMFDTPGVIQPDTTAAANWQGKQRRRGTRALFLGISSGALGMAALAVVTLTPGGSASPDTMPPASPQATVEQVRSSDADTASSSLLLAAARTPDSAQTETDQGADDSTSNAIVPPESRSEPATPEPPASPQFGSFLLGTRGLTAVLYVEGAPQGAISRLRSWPTPVGSVSLSIRMDGCTAWDSTVVVMPDEELRIGYRRPTCAE